MRPRSAGWVWLGLPLVLSACDTTTSSPTGENLTIEPALALMATTWPGSPEVHTADVAGVLGTNIRGLHFDTGRPNMVFAVRSKPGALLHLLWDGTTLVPDVSSGFNPHKIVRYPGGSGNPALQGVTWDDEGTNTFLVVANRDNAHPHVSRNSILNIAPRSPSSRPELVAAQEWDLTADIKAHGPDGGAKTIQWAPIVNLTFNGFFDESKGHVFDPADYFGRGIEANGIIFVGLDNGLIHAYVLHGDKTFTRVQTMESGLPHVTALDFRKDDEIWATCDNRCAGRTAILELNEAGRFVPVQRFDRPAGMPNLDNEGFAFSQFSCLTFWSDVRNTHDHAIRVGSRCPTNGPLLPATLFASSAHHP